MPHTEKNTHVVDANLSIFDSEAIQVCVFAVSFHGSAISAQSNPWVASPCTATGCYQTVTGSQLTFGEATCKPRLRHGHVEDIHTSEYGTESHSCLLPCAYFNRLYRIIHKSVKHFKNSQQIDYATDHGNSYVDRERNCLSFFFFKEKPAHIVALICR